MTQSKKKVATTDAALDKKLAAFPSKSARIRFLAAEGMSTADIARKLGIRYQFARNVLVTKLTGPAK